MNSKLTLSVNSEVIQRAKDFAKKSNRSLSEIIESYLDKISSNEDDTELKELSKITGIIELPEDFNEKEFIRDSKSSKYL